MDKTDRNQNIEDNLYHIRLVRYGFNQKEIYLCNKGGISLKLNERTLELIKTNLESYNYNNIKNK